MNTDNKNKPQYAKLPQTVSAAKSRGLVTSLFLTALSASLGYIARVIIDNFPNYSNSISFIPHSQKTANTNQLPSLFVAILAILVGILIAIVFNGKENPYSHDYLSFLFWGDYFSAFFMGFVLFDLLSCFDYPTSIVYCGGLCCAFSAIFYFSLQINFSRTPLDNCEQRREDYADFYKKAVSERDSEVNKKTHLSPGARAILKVIALLFLYLFFTLLPEIIFSFQYQISLLSNSPYTIVVGIFILLILGTFMDLTILNNWQNRALSKPNRAETIIQVVMLLAVVIPVDLLSQWVLIISESSYAKVTAEPAQRKYIILTIVGTIIHLIIYILIYKTLQAARRVHDSWALLEREQKQLEESHALFFLRWLEQAGLQDKADALYTQIKYCALAVPNTTPSLISKPVELLYRAKETAKKDGIRAIPLIAFSSQELMAFLSEKEENGRATRQKNQTYFVSNQEDQLQLCDFLALLENLDINPSYRSRYDEMCKRYLSFIFNDPAYLTIKRRHELSPDSTQEQRTAGATTIIKNPE